MHKSLYDFFSEIEDPRRAEGRRHTLANILIIVTMASISGYHGYRPVGEFIENHIDSLVKFLKPVKDRLPSFDTVRRLLMRVNEKEMCRAFHLWALQYVDIKENEWISGDGKAIKGTVSDSNSEYQNFVNLVSIYLGRQKLVLGAQKFQSKKKSEIAVFRELLESLDIKDCTFSLDALHCQKKTAEAIIGSGNNYFLSVKGNQEALHESLKQQCAENKEIDRFEKREKNKGREENREIKVYNLDVEHPVIKEWAEATIGVKIRRWGVRKEKGKEKKYDETWYFISNKLHSAKEIYIGNRAHWRVESMHWVKDVVLGEDASKIKKGNAPGNYSMIRSAVCNILNFNGFKSIKSAIRGLANNIGKIWKLVNS